MTENVKAEGDDGTGAESAFSVSPKVHADWQEVVEINTAELPTASTREERASLQHEVAEFEERVLANEPAAARGYLTAFNARPAFRPPLDALIRLYTHRRSTANLAKLFDALVKAAPTARERADAHTLRGELLDDRLDDPAGARASYETAVATDPSHRVAWIDLERVAVRDGDAELRLRALAHLAELSQDPARRARLLRELAVEQASVGTAEALDEAARCLRDASVLPGARWQTLRELERFAERTGRPEDLVLALEGQAALAAERAGREAVAADLEGVWELAMVDGARAVSASLWARAARVRFSALDDPEGAWAAMEQCLSLDDDSARVHYLAMTLADQVGDVSNAAAHAEWLLARSLGDPTLRAAMHFRRAERAASVGDHTAASAALEQALELDPDSALIRAAMLEQRLGAGDVTAVAEFDDLAERAASPRDRAALLRAAAGLSLALSGNTEEATRRFRAAAQVDPTDATSRRAVLSLCGAVRRGDTSAAARRILAIDDLLPAVTDEVERAALLIDKLQCERWGLNDAHAAAVTSEQLVEATGEARWAMESAALHWAASGSTDIAARWAEAIADRDDPEFDESERRAWRLASARWSLVARDSERAGRLALEVHASEPSDHYATAMAMKLAWRKRDAEGLAAVALAVSEATAEGENRGERWLLAAAALLGAMGAEGPLREVLEAAVARAPRLVELREAVLGLVDWKGDAALRARVIDAALSAIDESGSDGDAPGASDRRNEAVALGVESALAQALVERDLSAAMAVFERVSKRSDSVVTSLAGAVLAGASRGPDSTETIEALKALLAGCDAQDPQRSGIELELARALGGAAGEHERDEAVHVGAEGGMAAVVPRVLSLVDCLQRSDRARIGAAFQKLAEVTDGGSSVAMRVVALANHRARGRGAEAWGLAVAHPEEPAAVIVRAEAGPVLERAAVRAEALEERARLAPEAMQLPTLRIAASWASIGRDDHRAMRLATEVLQKRRDDVVALDVVRVSGRRVAQWPEVVAACEQLGRACLDPSRAAEFWEEAGVVAREALGDEARAEKALSEALSRAPESSLAYRELRGIFESRADVASLEGLVSRRIEALGDHAERAGLLWEQARLRRALGEREGALQSATQVVELEPDHVAALAMVAEVHAASGRLGETARALSALGACTAAPQAQRRAARVGALELYQSKLADPDAAIEQLDALVDAGWADEALLQRAITLATESARWPAALRFARRAVEHAPPGEPRVLALLRVTTLLRDRLRDVDGARDQALRAQEISPESIEVLRVLLPLCAPADRARYARRSVEAIRDRFGAAAPTIDGSVSLAEAAAAAGDGALQRAALRAAQWLGANVTAAMLDVPSTRRATLRDAPLVLRYRNPVDAGRAVSMIELVFPELLELCGASLDGAKVGRSDRVKGPSVVRDAVAPWLSLAGVNEFELYVGGVDPLGVQALPGDPLKLVVGRGVTAPLEPACRFELVRRGLLAHRGLAAVATVPLHRAVAMSLAAMAYAELDVRAFQAVYAGEQRAVAKALSRRTRRALTELARPLVQSPTLPDDIGAALRAALSTVRRGALAVTGSLSTAFTDLLRVEGRASESPGSLVSSDATARELFLFAVSDAAVSLTRETGIERE